MPSAMSPTNHSEVDEPAQPRPQPQSRPQALQPPSTEPLRSPTSPHARDSSSADSIPSHNSDIYINSYYYGNDYVAELAMGVSNPALPAWTSGFAQSPINSPLLTSNDDRLIRRLSWNSNDDQSHPAPSSLPTVDQPESSSHQRNVSSADAGVLRGPLEFSPQHHADTFPPPPIDAFSRRTSSLPLAHAYSTSEIHLASQPMAHGVSLDSGADYASVHHDRAVLTSHQGGIRHSSVQYNEPWGQDFHRAHSPDDMEQAEPHLKSSADVYATAGQAPSSNLDKAKSGLKRFSKSVRGISRRVVHHQHGHVRLSDQDADESDTSSTAHAAQPATEDGISPRTHDLQLLRGKSLGIWGPDSRLRKSLSALLSKWWIEPLILLLILANTATLVAQSAESVYTYPRPTHYFGDVCDCILFAIFCIYTLELAARIIVSGFIINPPPLYAAPKPLAADSPVNQEEVKDFVPTLSEHRRRMSRSNTLDTLGVFGGNFKNKAQRVLAGNEGFTDSSSKKPPSPMPPRATLHSANASSSKPQRPDPSVPREQTRHPGRRLDPSETSMFLSESSVRSFWQNAKTPFAEAIEKQRVQAVHHAFLRHSWNRVDFVAVVSFWIAFGLAVSGQEAASTHHVYIFRALSVLRCARLLTATSGTSTILHSLKTSAFILLSVTFFTGFAMLLFGIIGIQSFEGSYRRNCVWLGDYFGQPGVNNTLSQMCGGYFDESGQKLGHVLVDGSPSGLSPKGFICPRGQICQEQSSNPEGNTESFDNILTSLLEVVILISANNWSETMYNMIDADYFASCLYFIIGIIILNFWLANLFVAVITNSFATLTARTQRSAFADQKLEDSTTDGESRPLAKGRLKHLAVGFKRVWGYTRYLWILAIIFDIGTQGSSATYLPPQDLQVRSRIELYFTLAFDFEIAMRFLAFVLDSDWRGFLASNQNRADLFLAVVTSIIQIPGIKNSQVYPWLTFFQLARFYRVIAAIPRMRVLLFRAFGSLNKMLNMVLFLLLMVGLASLIATQLFRGDIPQESDGQWTEMTFKQSFNSFLAMYQIFTSENWTDVLFSATSSEIEYKQAIIAGIFLSAWFLFANFIVLQMFIAVINENFSVAEHEKRQQQLERYLRRNEPQPLSVTARFLNRLSPYRWLKRRNAAHTGSGASEFGRSDHGGSTTGHTNKIVGGSGPNKRLEEEKGSRPLTIYHVMDSSTATAQRTVQKVKRMLRLDQPEEVVPLDNLQARRLRSSIHADDLLRADDPSAAYDADPADEAAHRYASERRLARMRSDLGLRSEGGQNDSSTKAFLPRSQSDARIQQAQFIASHPSYDKSYFLFSNHNRFRRFCQTLVPSSHGERLFGRPVSPFRYKLFQAVVFLAIVGSVVSAAIATPVYRRDYYAKYGIIRASWFSILELSLSSLFLAEFFVKTIADGFAFTPNAYVLSIWNSLDLFVLITLLVNVISELAVIGGVSRFTRALKAFRAFRLINLSALMRETFHAVMIAGAGRILDASILSILYIIPYAVWGQNLFAGLLYSCNDGSSSIQTKFDCSGEYMSSPGNFDFLAPRVWGNPTQGSVYSFDDFKGALLILFEIISLEGWINVMTTAMSVAGKDQQLQNDNRQVNALFFLVYNLVGSTTVLTLFVSVIIENFRTFSGAAYRTAPQRQWVDLRRLILRQQPSRRPKRRPSQALRAWCYDRMLNKNGWWSRTMTLVYLATLVTLMTQQFSDPDWANELRDALYLGYIAIYALDIVARLLGLGWRSYRENPWNLYDLFVVSGTVATTLPLLTDSGDTTVIVQFQKLFLTCVALKLVQKNHALNQLFKTAFSSLPAILSLFLLWLTMFLVWAIMLIEVFGLTKWGPNETYSKNFSTMIGSMVFLSMISTGEGWNAFMHDYTLSPPQCTPSANYLSTDCGSETWAYALFISWNVISMYIFLNMFTGTVVENFSYIFDLGSKAMLNSQDIRYFKSSWAKFDRQRKGYIQRDQIVPFLSSVRGALEVSLYPPECSLQALTAALAMDGAPPSPGAGGKTKGALEFFRNASPLRSPLREGKAKDGKEFFAWPASSSPSSEQIRVPQSYAERLASALSIVDTEELRMRKDRFNRIFHESVILMHPRKGISFTDMLLLLARTKLVDETEALNVEELIERNEILEQVEHRISLARVRGLLQMCYWRRRFLALRDEMQKGDSVPTILVHDSPNRSFRPALPALDIPSSSAASSPAPAEAEKRSTLTPTPSHPSLQDLEMRQSPGIESFEATAWGDLMRRIDGKDADQEHSVDNEHTGERDKRKDDEGWL